MFAIAALRPGGLPLLAAPDGRALRLPFALGRPLGPGPALRAPRHPPRRAGPADDPALGRPAQRAVPARRVGQREPGRAGERLPLRRPGRRGACRPATRPASSCSARRRWWTSRCARRREDRAAAGAGGRAGTNLAQALQLALATAPPGHANRFVLLTDGRQNAGNALAVAQAAKDAGADIYYVPAPLDLQAGSGRGVHGAPGRGEVRRAVPGQGGGVEPGGHPGAAVALPERRVPRLPGRAAARRARTSTRTASRSSRAGSTSTRPPSTSRATPSRRTTARWARWWCAGGRTCCSPRRTANQAQTLAAALRAQHIDVDVVEADRIPKDAAGSRSTTA